MREVPTKLHNIRDKKKLCRLISILKKAYKNEKENKFTKISVKKRLSMKTEKTLSEKLRYRYR